MLIVHTTDLLVSEETYILVLQNEFNNVVDDLSCYYCTDEVNTYLLKEEVYKGVYIPICNLLEAIIPTTITV